MNLVCTKERNRQKLENAIHLKYEDRDQVVSQIIWDRNSGKRLQEIYQDIKDYNYGWNWYQIEDEVNEVVHPGALTCPKCSDQRVKTRTRQTRSGDEGQTVFAVCFGCKYQWVCTN